MYIFLRPNPIRRNHANVDGSRLNATERSLHVKSAKAKRSSVAIAIQIYLNPKKKKAKTELWEKHYPEIQRLLRDERKTVPEAIEILVKEHGFPSVA